MAPIHRITELGCPGVGTLGSASGEPTQVAEEDAVRHHFIPADHVSAVLVSPHRILVTGGVTNEERVLPLTVLRYLDLSESIVGAHAWADPVPLRLAWQSQPSQRRARRSAEPSDPAFPVPRSAHTLTQVNGLLYLIGGLKLGGVEHGEPCKSIFALEIASETWGRVSEEKPAKSRSKAAGDNFVGPRFAHSALHYAGLPNTRSQRSRSRDGVLLVYGGFKTTDDKSPVNTVHAFNIKGKRWEIVPVKSGKAPTLAYHAAVMLGDHYMVVHGGNCGEHNDCLDVSNETHVFDVRSKAWIHPELHADSCEPPPARRKHSAVNGIGPQAGCAVFFGGERESGEFADCLHSLRLVHDEDNNITALWQQLPTNTGAAGAQPANAAGIGVLVSCPELSQYIFVGGRGPEGPRENPLAIAAKPAEENFSQTPMSSAAPDSIPLRLRRSPAATAVKSAQIDENELKIGRPSLSRSKSTPANANVAVESDVLLDQKVEIGKKQKKQVGAAAGKSRLNRATSGRRTRKAPLSYSESPPLPDDIAVLQKSHKKTKSGIKRPRIPTPMGTPVKSAAPANAEKPAPALPQVDWNASFEENSLSGKPDSEMKRVSPSPAFASVSRAARAANERELSSPVRLKLKPGARFEQTSPPVAKKMRSADSDTEIVPTESDPIDVDLQSSVEKDSEVQEVPVAAPSEPAEEIADEILDEENPVSGFVTSQALAQRGRAVKRAERARARSRRRGTTSRGRGRGRSRAAMQAEVDEMEKIEKLEKQVTELESEARQSDLANSMLQKENRELSKQVSDLIKEVDLIRTLRERAEKASGSGAGSRRGERSAEELAADQAQNVLNRQADNKIASLTSKVEDYQTELEKHVAENLQLISLLKETVQRETSLTSELSELKEIGAVQKVRINQFESELKARYELADAAARACGEKDQEAGRLKALLLDKDRKIQDLKLAKSVAGSRVEDGIAKLSSTKRTASSLQEELKEATAKMSRLEQAVSDWKMKSKELEKQLEQAERVASSKKSEFEDLEGKTIELTAKLKAREEECSGKAEECERLADEAKKAQEQSAKDRTRVAVCLAEQSRAKTAGEKARHEADYLRLRWENERKRTGGAVESLLRNVEAFTTEMSDLKLVSSEQANTLRANVQKFGVNPPVGEMTPPPPKKRRNSDILVSSSGTENGSGDRENAKQGVPTKQNVANLDSPLDAVGKSGGGKRDHSEVLVSSSGTENAYGVTPEKRRNGAHKGRSSDILVSSSGTEKEISPQGDASGKNGQSNVLVSSSGTEKEVSPHNGNSAGDDELEV